LTSSWNHVYDMRTSCTVLSPDNACPMREPFFIGLRCASGWFPCVEHLAKSCAFIVGAQLFCFYRPLSILLIISLINIFICASIILVGLTTRHELTLARLSFLSQSQCFIASQGISSRASVCLCMMVARIKKHIRMKMIMNTTKSQWKQKSQAPFLLGGLALFVFQTVTRQRNHLMNDCSIAPTIETKWLNCRKRHIAKCCQTVPQLSFAALSSRHTHKEVFIV
jgi:hypothetical protein